MSYVRLGRAPRPRAAFTLVELMVVIAIVGILLSLTAVAVYRIMGSSTSANANTLLSTIKAKVKRQWEAVADKARKEVIPSATNTTLMGAAWGNGDSEAARTIWVNYRLEQAFPTAYQSATATKVTVTNPDPRGWAAPWVNYTTLSGKTGVNANIAGQTYESSALLLLALEYGPESDKGGIGDQLNYSVGTFSPSGNVAANANNQVRALKDGWGTPLGFTVTGTLKTQLSYVISSAGPDGVFGNGDDLSSANLP
jgi:prepilin-type N-terminal cleavage/methylation domain-containing protein